MDTDQSTTGRQASTLPQRYQIIKRRKVGQHHVECSGSTKDIERKILDACRIVEKLITIEAIYITK